MARLVVSFVLLVNSAVANDLPAFLQEDLPSFLESAKEYLVTKVVNLLKDMQKQLEKEAEEDEVIYEKMVCWCNTNDKEKTKSIKEAEVRIDDLTHSIEEGTG